MGRIINEWCAFAILLLVVSSTYSLADDTAELKNMIQVLREEVNALVQHRQQDYNALEKSLKNAMEKNTELAVLKNQIRQLR